MHVHCTCISSLFTIHYSWTQFKGKVNELKFSTDDRKDTKSSSKIKDRKSGKYFHKNTGTSNSQSFRESSSSTNGAPPPMQDSTCVAEEVNEFNEKNVFFARSDAPRDWRPPHIQYKVGEVVTHVSDGYHGIIVGWDYECKVNVGNNEIFKYRSLSCLFTQAPDKWLKKYGYFNNKEKKVSEEVK